MPRFFFDLFLDKCIVLDPGGMLLDGPVRAMSTAGKLVDHLFVSRTELRESGSWLRVRDHRGNEIGRLNVDRPTIAKAPE